MLLRQVVILFFIVRPNISNTKKSCEGAGYASIRLMEKIKKLKSYN